MLTIEQRNIHAATPTELKTLKGIIYAIINDYDGKTYIGQSRMTFKKRYGSAWWRSTSNLPLQRTLKYAEPQDFKIYILEHSIEDRDRLNEREKFYADTLNAYCPNGYNVRECGEDSEMRCPIAKDRMRRGRESTRKTYEVKHIATNTIVKITFVKGWCQENGIDERRLRHMLAGYCATSQGYALAITDTSRFGSDGKWEQKGKKYTIKKISTGELITFENAHRFCRENGLSKGGMTGLLSGRAKISQGYCMPDTVIEQSRIYQVTRPDGSTEQFSNLKKFEEDNGICLQGMIYGGAKSNRQGWTNLFVFREGKIVRWRGSRTHSTPIDQANSSI